MLLLLQRALINQMLYERQYAWTKLPDCGKHPQIPQYPYAIRHARIYRPKKEAKNAFATHVW